jgi:F-type H+-transporting ATPase subunit b
MKNWITSFVLSNETESIGLNTNIFETNLINIVILLVILVYFLGSFLKENLSSRQEQIISSIQNGEKRLNEAKERLAEAKSQWAQAQIILEEIKNQTKRSKVSLLEAEFNQTNQALSQRFNNLLMILYYREQQVLSSIMKQVSELALKQVTSKLQTPLMEKDQYIIINNKINRLGGHL